MPYATRQRRAGFSLIELTVVSTLMAFLGLMISSLWFSFARTTSDMVTQAQVVSDAHFALESLRRDLSGHFPGSHTGTKYDGNVVGRLVTGSNQLMLCFDGDDDQVAAWGPPDRQVTYELLGDQLLRTDDQGGGTFVVANNVDDFQLSQLATGVRIELTLKRGDFNPTYTLISKDP